ncbi:hypothetical protein V1J52_11815 [Streptomyces sp. TRM 70351]|uniref:hypothetical protein n=1 Tax=Streptomyces sp. TRM 70351 TaxID=3116552 RepID=UPI002E7AD5E7|nr:hypothetical protein [Streptomyces sp. TRM 70351]MEE1928856.1 hypothetical protein [Streptomyces sp. TRM 70351]
MPVVVTELERITADPAGAAGEVWRRLGRARWQTLTEALDNPDGDRLHALQRERARRREAEREAAEREAQRPVCTGCGQRFTDTRWQEVLGRGRPWGSGSTGMCEPCAKEHFDRAEAERAARHRAEEAAPAAGGRSGGAEGARPVRPPPIAAPCPRPKTSASTAPGG